MCIQIRLGFSKLFEKMILDKVIKLHLLGIVCSISTYLCRICQSPIAPIVEIACAEIVCKTTKYGIRQKPTIPLLEIKKRTP